MRRMQAGFRSLIAVLVAAAAFGFVSGVAEAGSDVEPSILLIIDLSGSMNEDAGDGGTRLDAAKDALSTVVDELPDDVDVGLRAFGQSGEGCDDTELLVPLAPLDRPSLLDAIDGFVASGETPIGLSLEEARDDLADAEDATVILVTDGEDTCAPPDPCQVAEDMIADGIDVTIETVGFQTGAEAQEQLECIAEATGGQFTEVDDAADLADQLGAISERARRELTIGGGPVEGTADPREAPQIGPGSWQDTILADEQLFYAVDVVLDQDLTVSLFMADSVWLQTVTIELVGDDLDRLMSEFQVSEGDETVLITFSGNIFNSDSDAPEVCECFIRVTSETRSDSGGEFPFEIELEGPGFESAGASTTTTTVDATTTTVDTAEPTVVPTTVTESEDNDGGSSVAPILIGLLVLVVIGLVIVVIILLRRKPPGDGAGQGAQVPPVAPTQPPVQQASPAQPQPTQEQPAPAPQPQPPAEPPPGPQEF